MTQTKYLYDHIRKWAW